MQLNFNVPGDPVAQARPKFTTVGGHVHVYDAKKSRAFKNLVALYATEAAKRQGWKYQEGAPMLLRVDCFMSIPKSWPNKKKEDARLRKIYPTKKPDVDNIQKAIQDALNSVLFRDDAQFVGGSTYKVYSDEPRIEIRIEVIE